MLSFTQFKGKHSQKFKGLSNSEIQSRYNDYVAQYTSSGSQRVTKPITLGTKPNLEVELSRVRRVTNRQPRPRSISIKDVLSDGLSRAQSAKSSWLDEVPTGGKGNPLSPCSTAYAQARFNPFSNRTGIDGRVTSLPCVPNGVAPASFRYQSSARGVFTIGTSGLGYVAISPYAACTSATPSAGVYTTNTFTQSTYQPSGTGVTAFNNNSTYDAATWSGNAAQNFRIVGCGLKIKYSGSEMNRGGRNLAFRTMTNAPIPTGATQALIQQYRSTGILSVKRPPEEIVWAPDEIEQTSFWTYVDGTTNIITMGMFVFGASAGQAFDFEAIWYFESIGQSTFGIQRTEADPVGFALVNSAVPMIQNEMSPERQFIEAMKIINTESKKQSGFVTFLKDVGNLIGPMVKSTVLGLLA